ncbi:MAG: acyltransferase [Deltaproteobacteria bacterium]|nr:acyltransferase [Deltaproteobacteria bacterium]
MTENPFFVHPLAIVETRSIGEGTRIWGWSHVQEQVSIGASCNVGEHCFIENGVKIGDRVVVKNGISLWEGTMIGNDVFLGPHAVFSNERYPRSGYPKTYEPIIIEDGVSIGAGAIIAPGVKIGRYASVGAGAVVTRMVTAHALVHGNPARSKGWMCVCGLKLPSSDGSVSVVSCTCRRMYSISETECKLMQEGA